MLMHFFKDFVQLSMVRFSDLTGTGTIRIYSEIIIQIQLCKLFVQRFQSLFR